MDLGIFKPLLTGFLMPPIAPLLLALFGMRLVWKKKRTGLPVIGIALMTLWIFSCHGMAVLMAATTLPQFAPFSTTQFKTGKLQAQAIVVLGGGLLSQAPEYGQAQPSAATAARLRYGVWLARQSKLPIAFSGGLGWAADGRQPTSEAEVAARVALQDYGIKLRWTESASRDTSSNARLLAPMLHSDDVHRIILVTDAWHMARAVAAFELAGLTVTPAATGYVLEQEYALLEWLPSAKGMEACREVLRECLGLAINRFFSV